jgi:hypothetical protein
LKNWNIINFQPFIGMESNRKLEERQAMKNVE